MSSEASQGLSDVDISEALLRARQLAAKAGSGASYSNGVGSVKRPYEEDDYGGSAAKRLVGNMGTPIATLTESAGMHQNLLDTTTQTVEEWAVPDHMVGLIIGKNGESISTVQMQSQCRIQIAPDSGGMPNRPVSLSGSKAAIEKAKAMIQAVVEKGRQQEEHRHQGGGGGIVQHLMSGMSGGAGNVTFEMLVPGNRVGLVIGKGGETLKRIQDQTGARMVVIQDDNAATGRDKPLRIFGPPEAVEKAKQMVMEIVNAAGSGGLGGYASSSGGGGGGGGGGYAGKHGKSLGEVIVPRQAVGLIIGKGGETIKRIYQESGCSVKFKMDEDFNASERTAQLTGTPEEIQRATQMISEIVQSAMMRQSGGAQNIFYMHVPANKVGLVIGKGGSEVKQVIAESGATVELSKESPPNDYEKVFIIRGTPEQIHHAQHLIRIKVGDIPPGTPVPPFQPTAASIMPQQFAYPNAAAAAMPYSSYQDPNWANYYQQQQYYSQAGQPQGAAVTQAQPQAAPVAQTAAAPAINPQTGQPDYSAQWVEYYRSLGMHEQAAMIEQQAKATAAAQPQAYAPQQAQPAGAGAPQGYNYGANQYQQQRY